MSARTSWKYLKLPVLVGLAAGLYPVLFYYSNNYPLINSLKHLGFFVLFFLLAPVVACVAGYRLFEWNMLKPYQKYLLPFLSIAMFLTFLQISVFASLKFWLTLGILLVSGVLAFFLFRHLWKIAILQFIMAGLGLITLVPIVIQQLRYSDVWMQQPDAIAEATFKSTPNIYFLQPDGYVNFSQIDKGYYQIDNSEFKSFLKQNDFELYDDFRSNYNATIPSNMATFAMKHHYYNSGFNLSEVINGREVVVESNPVLDVLKKNGYKTHLLLEWPYLVANQPELGYDYCNFTNEDISLIGTGYTKEKDPLAELADQMETDPEVPKFFFVQILKPGHVPSSKEKSKGAAMEKELWVERLGQANRDLREAIKIIRERDADPLIVIMADHGGYVGMDYTTQMLRKSLEPDWMATIFSSQLAVRWPGGENPDYSSELKTPVNFFRVLFSYLSENESYLENLQENISMLVIHEGAPKGVYTCLDEEGNIIFEKQ